jgi:hypothetical protein
MPNVVRREGQTMRRCRRNELAVLYRHRRVECHEPAPLVGSLRSKEETREPRQKLGSFSVDESMQMQMNRKGDN